MDNQLLFLILPFSMGVIGTLFLFRKPAGHRVWKVADLLWIVLGGFGAFGAILAGVYTDDSSRIERQIDIAYAATTAFDRDAARFRLHYCQNDINEPVSVLCDKVDFLSASTAGNAELPLFIEVTNQVSPLQGLRFVLGRPPDESAEMEEMVDAVDSFDPDQFLAFAAFDEHTLEAMGALRAELPSISGDFQILAQSYETLISQVRTLKSEWEFLQENAFILLLQIISLSLVSFAAPFRLGKSLVELRAAR
ncbi:hypothetical protein ROA7450_03888 [Roseovarius albus]|uniref:Uncharacterized protein n=2 Tax=Roseovarius albus TaxID=1247867 RepID=A0A1X7A7N2_9RHOB|nr:hypothetical protein ROA7450_03888 [Roseovarius albus]